MASRVPKVVPSCNVMALNLTPTEAFVLSRVDGVSTEDDIVAATGLTEQLVAQALDKLAALGAVGWDGEDTRGSGASKASGSARASTVSARNAAGGRISHSGAEQDSRFTMSGSNAARASKVGGEPAGSQTKESSPAEKTNAPQDRKPVHPVMTKDAPVGLYDPTELDEPVDLDEPVRRLILDLYYQREELTYYELLGVSPHAPRQEIKKAYHELVAILHPDRYFRKNLGSFKPKMEALFALMTKAEETLSRKVRRKAYNDTLSKEQIKRAEQWAMRRSIPPSSRRPNSVSPAAPASPSSPSSSPSDPPDEPSPPPRPPGGGLPKGEPRGRPSSGGQRSSFAKGPMGGAGSGNGPAGGKEHARKAIVPPPPIAPKPVKKIPSVSGRVEPIKLLDDENAEGTGSISRPPRSRSSQEFKRISRASGIPFQQGKKISSTPPDRLRAAAQKLRGAGRGSMVPGPRRSSVPPAPDPRYSQHAMEALHEFSRRRSTPVTERITADSLMKKAYAACKNKDWVLASKHVRQALELDPHNAELQALEREIKIHLNDGE